MPEPSAASTPLSPRRSTAISSARPNGDRKDRNGDVADNAEESGRASSSPGCWSWTDLRQTMRPTESSTRGTSRSETDPRRSRRGRRVGRDQVYVDMRALKVDLSFAVGGVEDHGLLRAPGRRRRRPRGPSARSCGVTPARRRLASDSRRRAWPAAAGPGRRTTGTKGVFNSSAMPNTFPIWNASPLVARRLRARVLPRLPDGPRRTSKRSSTTSTGRWSRRDQGVRHPAVTS